MQAFLDYHNIAYRVVEVDPLRKTQLKQFSSDYRKVPIAVIDSKQINGSDTVISALSSTPASSTELEWLKWLDDKLIHLIAPNIYRTWSESLQTFNYITDHSKFSTWDRFSIRYTGAAAMYAIGKRLKKKYDIQDERKEIHEAINTWMKAITKGGSGFIDGAKKPGIVDLSVYGVLKAIQNFDTFTELTEQSKDFEQWFNNMTRLVGDSAKTTVE